MRCDRRAIARVTRIVSGTVTSATSASVTSTQRFITSTGQIEPAMQPVRSDDRSKRSNSGCSSSAMNIVGTP